MGLQRLTGAVQTPRGDFLTLEEAQPYLGTSPGNNHILVGNADGTTRYTQVGNVLIEGTGINIEANGLISIDPDTLNLSNALLARQSIVRYDYVTTDPANVISGADVDGKILDFGSNDFVMVYVDGFLIQPNEDYTYNTGNVAYLSGNSNVILGLPTYANSIVSIVRVSPTLFSITSNTGGGAGGFIYASNVIEDGNTTTGNVFFTNNRARGAFTAGQNITLHANGLIVSTGSTFSGTTDNILEGSANIYFTNTRARNAISGNTDTGISYDVANGIISLNANTTLIPEGANLYFTNNRALLAIRNNISTTYVVEGSNLYFTNTRAIRALTAGDNITIESNGLVVAAVQAFTGNTTIVPEGANLYFNNTRAREAVKNNINTTFVTEGANLYFTNARVLTAIGLGLSTSNISEGANLYFTNARVISIVSSNITTSNIAEGSNLYFTNTRAIGSLTAGQNIFIAANGLVTSAATLGGALPTFYTSNIVENGDVATGNVYFTTGRARAAFQAGIGIAYDVVSGTIAVGSVPANLLTGLFTSNVVENGNTTTGNVYFTNTRAIKALTAGQNIVIESNGLIISSATVSGLPTIFASNIVEDGNTSTGNVYFTNARARGAFTAGPGLTLNTGTGTLTANVANVNGLVGQVILTTSNIAESGANLYFTNARSRIAISAGTGLSYDQTSGEMSLSGTTYTDANAVTAIRAANTLIVGNLIPSVSGLRDIGNATHPWRDIWVTASTIRLGRMTLKEEGGFLSIGAVANVLDATATVLPSGFKIGGITLTDQNNSLVVTTTDANGQVVSAATSNTGYIPEGVSPNGIANIYFTNTRAILAFNANGKGIAISSNGNVNVNLSFNVTTATVAPFINAFAENTGASFALYANTGDTSTRTIIGGLGFEAGDFIKISNNTDSNVNTIKISLASNVQSDVGNAIASLALFTNQIQEFGNTTVGNVYFTNTRARRAFTAGPGINDANLANGIISLANGFVGVANTAGYGKIDFNNTTGIVTYTAVTNANIVSALTAGQNINIAANGMISSTAAGGGGGATFTVANTAGYGKIDYDTGTNVLTYTAVTNANIRTAFSAGWGINAANLANGVVSLAKTNVTAQVYGNATIIPVFDLFPDGRINTISNVTLTAPLTAINGIDAVAGSIVLFTSNIQESGNVVSGNVYFTNQRAILAVRGNIFASNVIESGNTLTGNVFFTNARAVAALTGGTGISVAANGMIINTGVTAIAESSIRTALSANNGVEYNSTTGTFYHKLTGGSGITVLANGLIINTAPDTGSPPTQATIRAAISVSNVTGFGNIQYDSSTGIIKYHGPNAIQIVSTLSGGTGITVAANGLITATGAASGTYTNANAYANLLAALPNYTGNLRAGNLTTGVGTGGQITGANLIVTNILRANIIEGLTIPFAETNGFVAADKVIETGNTTSGNVFFSNTRARRAITGTDGVAYNITTGVISHNLSAGTGIGIAANGMITNLGIVSIADNDIRNKFSANNGVEYNTTTGTFYHKMTSGAGIVVAANGLITGAPTSASIRSAITATNGVQYDSATGVIQHSLSAGAGIAVAANGMITNLGTSDSIIRAAISATNGVQYNSATGVISHNLAGGFGITIAANGMITNSVNRDGVNAWSRTAISATNGVQYNSGTGVIQHNMLGGTGILVAANGMIINTAPDLGLAPTQTTIRTYFSANNGVEYNSTTGTFYHKLTGGTGIAIAANGMVINTAPDTGAIPSQATIRTYITAINGVQYNQSTGVISHNLVGGSGIVVQSNGLIVSTVSTTGAPVAGTGITVTGSTVSFNGAASSINTNVRALSVGSTVGQTTTDGEIRAGNDITSFYSSDKRLKTNIHVIENALDKLELINGVTFDWTDDYINSRGGEDPYFIRRNDVGVLADELELILPQLVGTREDGYKAVKYDRIAALLIQAIKELRIEVNDLKKQINKG